MSSDVILRIEGISKEFPGVKALSDVSFNIQRGEIHAIIGENGAGKSTLMNILFGEYAPTAGNLLLKGNQITLDSPRDAQQRGIAMVHQELSLALKLTIAENIYQGRLPKKRSGLIDYKKLYTCASAVLKKVGLEHINPRTKLININHSQQQQVEIAKALSLNATLLILDEPTSALTPNEADMLLGIMRNLQKEGVTMLYISHKLEEVLAISDTVTILRDGLLVKSVPTSEIDMQGMISSMVGRDLEDGFVRSTYKADYSNTRTVLEVKNFYMGTSVIDVSFTLYEGEVLGIAGLVGSGRSELLQGVFGADKKDSGQVRIQGEPVAIHHCSDAIAQGLALVPEGRKSQGLFLQFNVLENTTILTLKSFIGRLGLLSKKAEKRQAGQYCKQLRVKTPSLYQKIINLSGGNQQKTIIARCLMNTPKVLFLDEPTQGIDVGAKKEIYEIIDTLAKEGVSIVMVSSEMPEILSLCDRIITMHEGRLTGEVLHAEATEEQVMTLAAGQVG